MTYPFTLPDFNKRVVEVCRELGMQNVQGARVLAEYQDAGVIEPVVIKGQRKLRFTHKIGSLTDLFGKAISVQPDSRFEFDAEKDFGRNECDETTRPPWKGTKPGVVAGSRF